jgi:hypothetical protein
MRYVLDASVALCWVIPRPLSPKALQLRDDYRKSLHELIAPSVFPAETASGLTKAERQKIIPVGDARPLLAEILRTLPALHAYLVNLAGGPYRTLSGADRRALLPGCKANGLSR